MDIRYRRLGPQDTQHYRALRLESLREFPYNFGASYDEQMALPKIWMEGNLESGTDEAFMVGAFDGDELIGMCGVVREGARNHRHRANVVQMYVQSRYSGRKIGLGLTQATIAEAWKIAELEHLVLEVVTSNPGAIHVYSQAGFEQFAFHRDFLKIGERYEDAFLMILFRG